MIKILFVCHGNICRSPMAEFILKDMTARRGIAAGVSHCFCGHQYRGNLAWGGEPGLSAGP